MRYKHALLFQEGVFNCCTAPFCDVEYRFLQYLLARYLDSSAYYKYCHTHCEHVDEQPWIVDLPGDIESIAPKPLAHSIAVGMYHQDAK